VSEADWSGYRGAAAINPRLESSARRSAPKYGGPAGDVLTERPGRGLADGTLFFGVVAGGFLRSGVDPEAQRDSISITRGDSYVASWQFASPLHPAFTNEASGLVLNLVDVG
jgi:hypothetical protein